MYREVQGMCPLLVKNYKKEDISFDFINKFQYDCTRIITRNVEYLDYVKFCGKYHRNALGY